MLYVREHTVLMYISVTSARTMPFKTSITWNTKSSSGNKLPLINTCCSLLMIKTMSCTVVVTIINMLSTLMFMQNSTEKIAPSLSQRLITLRGVQG